MNTAYAITQKIKDNIAACDRLRAKILLTPMNPKTKRHLDWYFLVERVSGLLVWDSPPIESHQVSEILLKPYPKKPNLIEKKVFASKKVFEYLSEGWTVNPNPIQFKTVQKIYEFGCKPYLGKMTGITQMSSKMVEDSFNFLNQGKEHPIILSGIAYIEFISARVFEYGNHECARIIAYLMLYKNGYDINGMYSLDKFHKAQEETYKKFVENSSGITNATTWLEYYSQVILEALEASYQTISQSPTPFGQRKLLKLNRRQNDVLKNLEVPGSKITNKEYQKMFGVSQITASRDLTKLNSLGLVLSKGKGRSVFYTKV